MKIPSIPKVYAVEPGGALRWIETEAVAKALFGDDWAKRVDDVSEAYFSNYHEGAPLTTPSWPTGTYVRRASDTAMFFIDGLKKRYVPPSVLASLRLNDAHVIATSSDLSSFDDAGSITEGDWKYLDASQKSYIDTLPRPQFDFPVSPATLEAGKVQTLAVFRLTSGMPVIIRQLRVTIKGPMWNGTAPRFTDLRFVDVMGQELFGTKQLEQTGADTETITFSGAYTMPERTISVVELNARTVEGLGAGATFTVTLDRAGVQLADGGNGNPLTEYYPRTAFPTFTLMSK